MTKKKRMAFADVIISLCVAVSFIITAAIIYEYHRLDEVLTPGVAGALFGFWGGELLIIALRQIFGSDAVAKSKQSYNTEERGI